MQIARIRDGIVVNIELADQEWIDANQGVDGYTFIAYDDLQPAHIGLGWNEVDGFGQPDPYPRGKYAGIGDLWTGTEFVPPPAPVEP